MSYFTEELREFAQRLGTDGYPTALIERAAERMEQMEELIVELSKENNCGVEQSGSSSGS